MSLKTPPAASPELVTTTARQVSWPLAVLVASVVAGVVLAPLIIVPAALIAGLSWSLIFRSRADINPAGSVIRVFVVAVLTLVLLAVLVGLPVGGPTTYTDTVSIVPE